MQGSAEGHQWNMFRRRDEELWCAVPAECEVPPFLFSGAWDFRDLHPGEQAIPGYRRGVAEQSVRMNGFYLFQLLGPEG